MLTDTMIKLRSGVYIDLDCPDPALMHISDIAGALSKLCRFNGQCGLFYSVAEHCVLCCLWAEELGYHPDVQFAVLLHDAVEAYIGDKTRPLKRLVPAIVALEARWQRAVAERFDLSTDVLTQDCVRRIDTGMLLTEKTQLFVPDSVKWECEDEVQPIPLKLRHWSPYESETQFLNKYEEVLERVKSANGRARSSKSG